MTTMLLIGVAAVSTPAEAGKHDPTPAGAAEVAISSATVPAGATAQLTFRLTQPNPIMSTGSSFAMDGFSINGIGLWSPTGVACGIGSLRQGVLHFSLIDPTGDLGSGTDYPFLTLTMTVPDATKPGTSFPFDWSPDAWMSNSNGPVPFTTKPGKITIGGSVAISGVYPGGGTYPPGTLIRVLGRGFQNGARIQTPVKYSSISISPTEIDLFLKDQTTIDSQAFAVTNPDGSTATFFAYLRGTMLRWPSNNLLQTAEFAFPLQTHTVASIAASGALPASRWIALALQNPNAGPAAVTIELGPNGHGRSALFVLPPGGRIADTISGFLNGIAVQPTDSVRITSTAMIQMFGINGDDAAQTLNPFILTF